MRIILYRGYDFDDAEVLGCYVQTEEGPAILCQDTKEFVFINPGDVSEFTGMNDINTTPIFENDMLTGGDLAVIVTYRDGAFYVGDALLSVVVADGWVVYEG